MSVDHVSATIAALEAPASPSVESAVASPPPPVSSESAPVAPDEATADSTPPSEPKPESKPEAKPDRVAKGYEDLAREKAAFRAEREKFKAETAVLEKARALVEAGERGDAIALLKHAKIPWSKAAKQALNGEIEPEEAAPSKPDPRDERLAALEREVAEARELRARTEVLSKVRETVKDPRFARIVKLGVESEVMDTMARYFRETGEVLAETLEESIEIAAEMVEKHHAKMAERYRPFLTSGTEPATVTPVKPEVPAVGAKSQSAPKTLKNSDGSGPQAASTAPKKPKTDEEYQLAALEAITAQ